MSSTSPQHVVDSVRSKADSGERLTPAEAAALFDPQVDLHALGQLADQLSRRRHGGAAYYNVNAHLNPTNVCRFRCPLCAYSRDPGDPDAYVMSRGQMLQRGREAAESGATELHIVGGVHPDKGLDWYLDILGGLHAAFPRLHLKAWTAVEGAWLAQQTGLPIRRVLEEMIAAGLGSLPGGGAEIFDPEVRRRILRRIVWLGENVNQYATPALASDSAEMILKIAQLDRQGIFHCTSGESIERKTLALRVADVFGFDRASIQTGEPPHGQVPRLARIPNDTSVNAQATAHALNHPLLDIQTLLERFKREFTN